MNGLASDEDKIGLEILRWYIEAGVDMAIDETPHDRLAEGRAEAKKSEVAGSAEPAQSPVPKPGPQIKAEIIADPADDYERKARERDVRGQIFQPTAYSWSAPVPAHATKPDEAVLEAARLAASADTLEALRGVMERFDGCALKTTATQLVFGDGEQGARIMIVGEAPGRDEDQQGLPFVGRAGQLLNRMLASIGLKRGDAYIANVVPWRPPGNRTPTTKETAICKPFIERQIELVAPEILVCLGGPSSQTLLNQKTGILSIRGRWFDYACGARSIKAIPSLHPAYLLRQPSQKRLAWRDLLAIRDRLDGRAQGDGK